MAGKLLKTTAEHTEFHSGAKSHSAPLSAIDKKMINFAIKSQNQPVTKTHGQILLHFGMYPPEFWNRVQGFTSHPNLSKRHKAALGEMF